MMRVGKGPLTGGDIEERDQQVRMEGNAAVDAYHARMRDDGDLPDVRGGSGATSSADVAPGIRLEY